jgi:hypothetical protein
MGLDDFLREGGFYTDQQDKEPEDSLTAFLHKRGYGVGADASTPQEPSLLRRAEHGVDQTLGLSRAAKSPTLTETATNIGHAVGMDSLGSAGAAGQLAALGPAAGPIMQGGLAALSALASTPTAQAIATNPVVKSVDRAAGIGFGWLMDQLSRGQYAGAKLLDVETQARQQAIEQNQPLFRRAVGTMGAAVRAIKSAVQEGLVPDDRLSTSDVFAKVNPDFAQRHPVATSILGFIGDVAIDPTTYLSFGETNAVQHLVTDGTIGLDRAAVRKAAIEAGVKTSKFDALGKLVGRPSASAEKALAKESERAVGQFFEHQLGKVEEEATTDAKKLAEEHAKAVAEHATEQKAALSEFVSGESSEHQRVTRSKKAVDEFFGAGGGNGQVNLLDPETFQAKVQQLATTAGRAVRSGHGKVFRRMSSRRRLSLPALHRG